MFFVITFLFYNKKWTHWQVFIFEFVVYNQCSRIFFLFYPKRNVFILKLSFFVLFEFLCIEIVTLFIYWIQKCISGRERSAEYDLAVICNCNLLWLCSKWRITQCKWSNDRVMFAYYSKMKMSIKLYFKNEHVFSFLNVQVLPSHNWNI